MNIVSSIFNLGGPDMIIILLIVLLLFGAKRLPELARGLGQAINEFSKAKDDVQRQITRADEPPVVQARHLQEHLPQETAGTVGTAAPAAPEVAPSVAPQDKPQV